MALKLKLIAKNAQTSQNHFARTERRLKDSLRRTIAYGRVTKENSISKLMGTTAYKDALNRSYTYKALRFHLVEMLSRMEPRYQREEDTKKRVDIARDQFQEVIDRNLARLPSPRAAKREAALREKQKREEEMRRQQRRWMPRADPIPPIEESLFYEPPETKREFTLIKTQGITTKAHFKRPDSQETKEQKTQGVDEVVKGLDNLKLGATKEVLPPIATT